LNQSKTTIFSAVPPSPGPRGPGEELPWQYVTRGHRLPNLEDTGSLI